MKNEKPLMWKTSSEVKELPTYEVPQVTTYTQEQILEELGPALAVISPNNVDR